MWDVLHAWGRSKKRIINYGQLVGRTGPLVRPKPLLKAVSEIDFTQMR